MHFLENSMFILNAYFCRELRFVASLGSKLRFLLRNTGVDSDFTQNFWGKNWRLRALPQVLQPTFRLFMRPSKLRYHNSSLNGVCWLILKTRSRRSAFLDNLRLTALGCFKNDILFKKNGMPVQSLPARAYINQI